mgnify:CR=1 FL=1
MIKTVKCLIEIIIMVKFLLKGGGIHSVISVQHIISISIDYLIFGRRKQINVDLVQTKSDTSLTFQIFLSLIKQILIYKKFKCFCFVLHLTIDLYLSGL